MLIENGIRIKDAILAIRYYDCISDGFWEYVSDFFGDYVLDEEHNASVTAILKSFNHFLESNGKKLENMNCEIDKYYIEYHVDVQNNKTIELKIMKNNKFVWGIGE